MGFFLLQSGLFIFLLFYTLVPGLSLLERIMRLLVVIAFLWISFYQRKRSNSIKQWLCSTNVQFLPVLVALSFFCLSGLIYGFLPHSSISLTVNDEHLFLSPNRFLLSSSHLPNSLLVDQEYHYEISAAFYLPYPTEKIVFSVSKGDASWQLNGEPIIDHHEESHERNLAVFKPLSSGWYGIQVHGVSHRLFPQISIEAAAHPENPPNVIKGPFYPSLFSVFPLYSEQISVFFAACGLFLSIPLLNRLVKGMVFVYQMNPRFTFFMIAFAGVLGYLLIRLGLHPITFHHFEADEAAFGIMAQHLLHGQAPPVFHYGQNYQGTIEVYPLSLLISLFGSNAMGLHLLSEIFGALFFLILFISISYFFNRTAGMFSLIPLVIGGAHYHWIFSKLWFGYAFTLFCGVVLTLVVFHVCRAGFLSSGWGFLWGGISALSFYALPISAPIILSSFLAICYVIYCRYQISWQTIVYKPFFLFFSSGLFFSVLVAFLGLFPYWLPYVTGSSTESLQFLSEGRELLPPRSPDEDPLFDRFLQECLPVLFGSNPPYSQYIHHYEVFVPWFIPSMFVLSLLMYPFIFDRKFLVNKPNSLIGLYLYFWLLAVITVFTVTNSPFGIWPWYAISIYIAIPILFYNIIFYLWRCCPALSFGACLLYALVAFSSLFSYSPLYQQPLSLAAIGHKIDTDFSRVQKILEAHNIRYAICEQGYDSWTKISGKDWVGESLYYDSDLQILSVDRLSRRDQAAVQEIIDANRVAYIFHKDFFFSVPSNNGEENHFPLSLKTMDALFGNDLLDYQRVATQNYVIYIPPKNYQTLLKSEWELSASNEAFLATAIDNNISVRLQSSDTYWSSGPIGESGAWFRIEFPQRLEFSKLILFHGIKAVDHPTTARVFLLDEQGLRYPVGEMKFNEEAMASVLNLGYVDDANGLYIQVNQPYDKRWFTVVEAWVR